MFWIYKNKELIGEYNHYNKAINAFNKLKCKAGEWYRMYGINPMTGEKDTFPMCAKSKKLLAFLK